MDNKEEDIADEDGSEEDDWADGPNMGQALDDGVLCPDKGHQNGGDQFGQDILKAHFNRNGKTTYKDGPEKGDTG